MPTMAAALFDPGKLSFRIAELPRPEATPGTVVVKTGAAGICGSDLHYMPLREGPETAPSGHESAGEIVEVGAGVSDLKPGEHVAMEFVGLARACLSCWYCRQGQFVQCTRKRPGAGGAFAEYVRIAAAACFRLDDRLSWEQGALVEPLSVGLHGVRRAGLRSFETAVVLGAGTIGLATIAAARGLGAARIIATAKYPEQAAMAKKLGADRVLAPEDEGPWTAAAERASGRGDDQYLPAGGSPLWEAVAEATDGRGADVVFESVGGTSGGPLLQAIAISRKQGRIVSVGVPKGLVPVSTIIMLRRELDMRMSHCYSVIEGRHDYEVSIELLASGRASLGQIVTHRFALKDMNEAFETAHAKSSGVLKVQLLGPQ